MELNIPWYRKYETVIGIFGAAPLWSFVLFLLFHAIVLSPRAKRELKSLEFEFSRIAPHTQSHVKHYHSFYGINRASVSEEYWTLQEYSTIQDYYEIELMKNDWKFSYQEHVSYSFIKQVFCKGDYTATLNFDDYTRQYSFYMYWGQLSECQRAQIGKYVFLGFEDTWFLLLCSIPWMCLGILIARTLLSNNRVDYLEYLASSGKRAVSIWSTIYSMILMILLSALGMLIAIYTIIMYLRSWVFAGL